ncbi:hypothetical protein [Gymnodinialimonas sp. 57CJ19]|uniref:winged helix domain-containing protein n=1 Tax=Gymnodinialimonas sp. 57CJ19 TaxID=3138498 RepID=UPI0031344212
MADSTIVRIRPHNGVPFTINVKGRDLWALEQLAKAAQSGVSPRDEPTGPRWSAYIHNLRGLGVPIETRREPHGGEFPGTHGRYILHATIERLSAEVAQ